jgi:hypothetical protein
MSPRQEKANILASAVGDSTSSQLNFRFSQFDRQAPIRAMALATLNWFSTIEEHPKRFWKIALILTSFYFACSLHYGGLTWDESAHFDGTGEQVDLAYNVIFNVGDKSYTQITSDYAFYGLGVLLPAYALSYVWDVGVLGREHLFSGSFSSLLHILSFACGVAGACYAGKIVELATERRDLKYVSASVVLLTPIWLGYALFDYKDVPIAMGVLATLYYGLAYRGTPRPALLLAFFVALVFLGAQRIAAVPLALPIIGLIALRTSMLSWGLFAGGLYVVTPPAWTEPLKFGAAAMEMAAHFPSSGCTLTAGECIGRNYMGGAGYSAIGYLAKWYGAQLPLAFIAVFALSGVIYVWRFRSLDLNRHVVAASLVWPIAAITLADSTFYDGVRHTIFLVPLAIVASFVILSPSKFEPIIRLHLPLMIYIAFLFIDSVKLFPSSYTYFNEATRFSADEHRYETDYWGFSLREAAEKAARARLPSERVLGSPSHLVDAFLPPGVAVDNEEELPPGAHYLLVRFTRWHGGDLPNNCELIDSVKRRQILGRVVHFDVVARCIKL